MMLIQTNPHLDAVHSLVRLTYPTIDQEPVSVNEVVAQAKIDKSAIVRDQGLIQLYIQAARDYVEAKSRVVLAQSNWQLVLDTFAFDPIPLSLFPVTAITRIDYYDLNNTLQTVDPSIYNIDLLTQPGRIQLAYGRIWPYTAIYRPDAVIVYFTAGLTPGAANFPPSAKLAVLMLAAEMYQRRTPVSEMRLAAVPYGIDSLIATFYRGVYQ